MCIFLSVFNPIHDFFFKDPLMPKADYGPVVNLMNGLNWQSSPLWLFTTDRQARVYPRLLPHSSCVHSCPRWLRWAPNLPLTPTVPGDWGEPPHLPLTPRSPHQLPVSGSFLSHYTPLSLSSASLWLPMFFALVRFSFSVFVLCSCWPFVCLLGPWVKAIFLGLFF